MQYCYGYRFRYATFVLYKEWVSWDKENRFLNMNCLCGMVENFMNQYGYKSFVSSQTTTKISEKISEIQVAIVAPIVLSLLLHG